MEAVFQLENFRIFSGDLRAFRGGTGPYFLTWVEKVSPMATNAEAQAAEKHREVQF